MDLTEASAVITGGASGIGEASARKLSALGARCVIVDLQDDKGEAVAKELGGLYVKADVANEEQVQAAMDAAMEMLKKALLPIEVTDLPMVMLESLEQ